MHETNKDVCEAEYKDKPGCFLAYLLAEKEGHMKVVRMKRSDGVLTINTERKLQFFC